LADAASNPKGNTGGKRKRKWNPVVTIAFWLFIFLFAATAMCIRIVGRRNILSYAGRTKPYSLAMVNFCSEDLYNPDTRKVVVLGDSLLYYPPDMFPHEGDPNKHFHKLLQAYHNPAPEDKEVDFHQWAFMAAALPDFYCMFYEAEKHSPRLIIVEINWYKVGRAFGNMNPQLTALAPLVSELPSGYTDPIRSRGISLPKQLSYKLALELPLYPVGIKNWSDELKRGYIQVNSQANAEEENIEGKEVVEGFTPAQPGNTQMARMFGQFFEKEESKNSDPNKVMPKEAYPMRLERTNIAFRDLEALAKVASLHKTPILFVIFPVDKERLIREGKWDQASFDRSKRLIAEATSLPNCYLADLSEILGSEYFADRRGHCYTNGRRRMAKQLAPEVSAILNNRESQSRREGLP